jgi:NRPS condensation-like uncharacterized protein
MMITFHEPIVIEALQRAVVHLARRTPYFQVHLRRGAFWYYLERHDRDPEIHLLPAAPISPIAIKRPQEPLYRVQAWEASLAIDFSHILTDGYGGMRLLLSLAAEYLRQCGVDVPNSPELLDPDESPAPGEIEDAYKRYYTKDLPTPESLGPAYHLPGIRAWQRYRTIIGRVPLGDLRHAAKERGVTVTQYLVATYLQALASIHAEQAQSRLPPRRGVLRIEVPVNLRRLHSTETMRNFSLFVMPEIDLRLGEYTFEEILRKVRLDMQMQLEKKQLGRQIARNVGGELNPVVRAVPLALKDWYLSFLHRKYGDDLYSGVISNLGPVVMPDEMASHVRAVDFVLGPNPAIKKNLAVVSYADEVALTFGSVVEGRDLERLFFRSLAAHGIPVTVTET